MITVDLTYFVLFCLCTGLAVIFILSAYYDLRDSKIRTQESVQTVYHCVRCDHIYSLKENISEAECPRCGFRNHRLQF